MRSSTPWAFKGCVCVWEREREREREREKPENSAKYRPCCCFSLLFFFFFLFLLLFFFFFFFFQFLYRCLLSLLLLLLRYRSSCNVGGGCGGGGVLFCCIWKQPDTSDSLPSPSLVRMVRNPLFTRCTWTQKSSSHHRPSAARAKRIPWFWPRSWTSLRPQVRSRTEKHRTKSKTAAVTSVFQCLMMLTPIFRTAFKATGTTVARKLNSLGHKTKSLETVKSEVELKSVEME